jgi:hypothetical protein
MQAHAIAETAGRSREDATGLTAPALCEFSQLPAAVIDAEFADRGELLSRAGALIEHCAQRGDRLGLELAIRAARSITLDLCQLFREVCPNEASR